MPNKTQTIDITPSWSAWGRVYRRLAESGETNALRGLCSDHERAMAMATAFTELSKTFSDEQNAMAAAIIAREIAREPGHAPSTAQPAQAATTQAEATKPAGDSQPAPTPQEFAAISTAITSGATRLIVEPNASIEKMPSFFALEYPDGREGVKFNSDHTKTGNAHLNRLLLNALEQLAWLDYIQHRGKIVMTSFVFGLDENNDYQEVRFHEPMPFRVNEGMSLSSIRNWTDDGDGFHLDSRWDVTPIGASTTYPEIAKIRSLEIYAISRCTNGSQSGVDFTLAEDQGDEHPAPTM